MEKESFRYIFTQFLFDQNSFTDCLLSSCPQWSRVFSRSLFTYMCHKQSRPDNTSQKVHTTYYVFINDLYFTFPSPCIRSRFSFSTPTFSWFFSESRRLRRWTGAVVRVGPELHRVQWRWSSGGEVCIRVGARADIFCGGSRRRRTEARDGSSPHPRSDAAAKGKKAERVCVSSFMGLCLSNKKNISWSGPMSQQTGGQGLLKRSKRRWSPPKFHILEEDDGPYPRDIHRVNLVSFFLFSYALYPTD